MKIGDTFEVRQTVTPARTAEALGSGGLSVYATPCMLALMESAAYQYLQLDLPEGKSSVGTLVRISHLSPSPVGMEITATAEVTGISENGKLIDFKVTARDRSGLIGEGTHQRAIITTARFLEKSQAKLSQ